MTAAPTVDRARRLFVPLAVLLTMAGLGLRFYRLSGQSLWTDEVSSISVARAPLSEIYEQSAVLNNSLPTYFLVLRPLLGDTRADIEIKARWLSAVAGGLSIPVFIGVVLLWRRHYGTALMAGLLLAVNPLHVWYSQEVRAYALMLFFGLLALLFFELGRRSRGWWWWALYGASGLAAMAVHKTGLVFPAVCVVWHGWEVTRRQAVPKQLLAHLPAVAAALVLFTLKSYPPGKGYGRRGSLLEIAYTFMTFVGGYSFGPSLTDIQSFGALAAVGKHPAQVGVLATVLLALGLGYMLSLRCLAVGRETLLLVVGIGVVALYALFSGFPYNIRYTLPALFGFLGLVAVMSTGASKPGYGCLLLAGTLLVAIWADVQWFYCPAYGKGNSRAVAQWLVRNGDHIKSWTVLPGYLGHSVEWYLQLEPQVLSRSLPPKEDRTTTFPPAPDVLIIGRRHHVQDPDKLIAAYAAAAGRIVTNRSFTGFELYVRTPAARPLAAP